MPLTNRGILRIMEMAWRRTFNSAALPTNLYIALATADDTPTVDTNVLSELTEIAVGNGYTAGGYAIIPGGIDFDLMIEDDTGDLAYIQLKDIMWLATGGTIPNSATGARWVVMTDDNATLANREVLAFWDLASDRQATDGQYFTLQDLELRGTQ